jgi:hypothetical protein
MNTLTKDDLQKLSKHQGNQCVSIYMPTHRKGKEVNEMKDARVLKNHYQDIKNELKDTKDIPENEALAYLKPINDLMEDRELWRHQTEGLAIFLSDDFFAYYHLPYPVEEYSNLSSSFYLMPLVSIFSDDDRYYLLSFSLNGVRLMEATRHNIRELEGGSIMKKGIEEIYKQYDFEKGMMNQSSSQGGGYPGPGTVPKGGGGPNPSGNKGGASFHGHGGATDDNDNDQLVVEYFQNVEDELKERIPNEQVPLILVGVDRLHPIFRDSVKSFNIYEEGINGNYEQAEVKDLHRMANELIEPHLSSLRHKQQDTYRELAGTGKASYDINDIAPAAIDGRIDTLFVVKGSHKWGTIDRADNSVQLKAHTDPGVQDLVSKAAVETVLNGGHTFFVEKEHLPENVDEAEMAAVFRW